MRIVLSVILATILSACAMQDQTIMVSPRPVSPQPTAAQVQPGLKPLYFSGSQIPADPGQGRPGAPILHLDLATNGLMWESRLTEDHAIQMNGLIQMEAGIYRFAATSDDGLRITIDQIRVVDDMMPHTSRQSPVFELRVTEMGWYPIAVQYVQQKGPAVLQVRWQPPGAGGLMPLPGAALAHLP